MSKVIFEFNLPDDQREYEVANQANNMQSLLWEFSQQLRTWRKYGNDFTSPTDALSKITDEFYRLINEHNVNIDL
jgi:hypothetical protein